MQNFQLLFVVSVFYLLVSCSFNQEEQTKGPQYSTLALTEAHLITTEEDTPISFDLGRQEGLTLEYRIIIPPIDGTVTNCFGVTPVSRNCQYTPNKNFNGHDRLTYQLFAIETGATQTAVIEFNITPVNDPPILVGPIETTIHVTAGETIKIDLSKALDIDSNTLSYKLEELPISGEVKNFNDGDNILNGAFCVYSSDLSFEGVDHLTYFVEDEEGTTSQLAKVTINITRAIDSDGDLIPDIQEKIDGTNPYVANVPLISLDGDFNSKISFKIKNPTNEEIKSIGLVSNFPNSNKPPLRRYLESISFLQYTGKLGSTAWTFDARFLHLKTLSTWNMADRELKKYTVEQYVHSNHKFVDESGEFNLIYGFDLNKVQSVSKIDSLSVGIYTLDKILLQNIGVTRSVLQNGSNTTLEFDDNSPQLYANLPLAINKLAPYVINDIISNGHELVGTIANFHIALKNNKQINFKDLVKNIYNKTARIIVSAPDKTDIYYVSPHITDGDHSLLSVLKKLNLDIELDDSETILSIGPYATKFIESIDIYKIPMVYLDKGRWLFFSETKSGLQDPIEVGKTYIFSYVTPKQMANMYRHEKELDKLPNFGKLTSNQLPISHTIFEEVRVGDIVTIKITAPTVNQYKITDYTNQVNQWDLERYISSTTTVCTKYGQGRCLEFVPMFHNPGIKMNQTDAIGSGNCVKWEQKCLKQENRHTYDTRRINQNRCNINYRRYQETRTYLPITASVSSQYFNRIILQGENGHYWRLSELFPSGFNSIVLKDLGMNNVAVISKLHITPEVFERLPMGQLVLTVLAEDPITLMTGYIDNNCTKNHDPFDMAKISNTFISEPHFDIDLKIEGHPRRLWR